jgi:predicted ABC-type ATPase
MSVNICNMSSIYTPEYSYSTSQATLEKFLSGQEFDNPDLYTPEESSRLQEDINGLWNKIMAVHPLKAPIAVITAGAPGSGKSTLLESLIATGPNYAYIDPDTVCLKNQTRTYLADINASDRSFETRTLAYTKWRPASNAASHLVLANLIKEKYAFYFGTTASNPSACKFFELLKNQGYLIKLIHVSAEDDVRIDSIKEREKNFVQVTLQGARDKGVLLPQRINDTFLKYTDHITFYHRDGVNEEAKLAAYWIKNPKKERLLTIEDLEAYERIKAIHNTVIEKLNLPELSWENTVEAQSDLILSSIP